MRILKILVAEDNEPFRRLICQVLQQKAEFAVIEACDLQEAVQKTKALQPDLVLLDSGLNGVETANQIRRLALRPKLLFVTLNYSSDVIRQTLRLGARGYVRKSRLHSDLLQAVEAVLEGKRFVSAGSKFGEGADALARHRHEVLFCLDDAVLLDSLTRFVATALNADNAAIVLVSESHREGLLRKLNEQGVAVAEAIQRGTLMLLDVCDALSMFMVHDWLDATLVWTKASDLIGKAAKGAKGEDRRVVTCGECAPTLWKQGKAEAAIQLEYLWDEIARNHKADTLCVYPWLQGENDDQMFKSLCAAHTAVFHKFNAVIPG